MGYDFPTIDFETEAIVGNPVYNPPKPVGVSIQYGDGPGTYMAWGHPTENNCSFEDARRELGIAVQSYEYEWLAHNAPFEDAVLRKYFGIEQPRSKATSLHDTQYLLFLQNPYASTFSLKPSAERLLGLPPQEQDAVKDWVLAHVQGASTAPRSPRYWAQYICLAPGGLVGKYAVGDTARTKQLFNLLHPEIVANGMEAAYQREQLLMPILSQSSRHGIRVDVEVLSRDIEVYAGALSLCDDYIRNRLGDINVDSDVELASALDSTGMVTDWVRTPTGKKSTSRKNLMGRVKDPLLLDVLQYRGVLSTCLDTFAGPWLEQALAEGGRVHPSWNQVRGDRGTDGDMAGARTGRMSCKGPNMQNPPNDFDGLVIPEFIKQYFELRMADGWIGPMIPHMRNYLLPDEGCVWLKRDFSAQEMRIMAHFAHDPENGVVSKLHDAFHKNPGTDPHKMVQEMIKELLGIDMPRKFVKITGFGIMYGRGIPNLSAALGVDAIKGKETRDAYFAALPEVRILAALCKRRGTMGSFIRTWGGRVYYREPNEDRDMSYKLLNYLIQGSASDQTKQSIIDWDNSRASTDVFLAAVHDENNICAPIEDKAPAMRRLRTAMDADRFDVPFLSEGFAGPAWGLIEEYEA
jgi:DNA polymerase I-like protein with 3'-5' exonuclease and polymerase domains